MKQGLDRAVKLTSALVTLLLFSLSLNGCGLAYQVSLYDPAETYRSFSVNALSSEQLSNETLQQLRIHSLEERYQKDPRAAVTELERRLRNSDDSDLMMAASEASFLYARVLENKDDERAAIYYIFAAQSAARFLNNSLTSRQHAAVSREPRLMANFYNESVARIVVLWQKNSLSWQGSKTLSDGELTYSVSVDTTSENVLDPAYFDALKPAYQLKTEGLKNHYRIYGAGAPLIGIRKNTPKSKHFDSFLTQPEIVQPITAALIFNSEIPALATSNTKQELLLRLYDPLHAESVPIKEVEIPLEADFSTSFGILLSSQKISKLWVLDAFKKAFSAELSTKDIALTLVEPYNPRKIPVVMIHGLFSSPVTYLEMINDLRGIKRIRENYQFLVFRYPTGLPVLFSSAKLRKKLLELAKRFDPDQKNPAFQNMILVSHSMGGLLSKSVIQKNGSAAWNHFFNTPLEDLEMDDDVRDLLREVFEYDALPFIRRTIFIATPHKGSDIAINFIGRLGSWLISAPRAILRTTDTLLTLDRSALRINSIDSLKSPPNSIDNLSPKDETLLLYQQLPFKDDLTLHSIIGISDSTEGPGSTDGVVRYESSHIEGVVSEQLVHQGHSCLEYPPTIAEVRRILLEHLDQRDGVNLNTSASLELTK